MRFVSLVLGLGLEHSCPWPRECLSSERLSLALALASDFFCVLGLGLEPCVLDSTSGDITRQIKYLYAVGNSLRNKFHKCSIYIKNMLFRAHAKRLYIKNLVNDNKRDSSSLWKIINKIIHLKNVKKNNIPNKMYASKSESAQGPQAISNLFNKYFIEIGVNLASTIKTPAIIDGKFNATSLIQSSSNLFFLEPIVEEEVVNYIRAMNPSKSTRRHGIPAKYIKMSGSVIAPVLPNIFNACISTGYFPKVLKTTEVVPIFKKGERELCSNYRPISILNPFAKLFEKCLLDQLNNYFVSNNLISPNQYGFKKNCSTNKAVLDIYNKLLDNMDKKLITCSIFLDLRKAYDTIDHTILIKKLEKYGIRGLPLQLLASYLTDRQQYTIINQYKSKSRDVFLRYSSGINSRSVVI